MCRRLLECSAHRVSLLCAARLVLKWKEKGNKKCEAEALKFFENEVLAVGKLYKCPELGKIAPGLFPPIDDPIIGEVAGLLKK